MAVKKVEIEVLKPFRDKVDHKTMYEPGTVVSFTKSRANDLVDRGLAKLSEKKDLE